MGAWGKKNGAISAARSEGLADLESQEAADRHLVAQLFADTADVGQNFEVWVFNEPLLQQAGVLIELREFAFDNLGDGGSGFAFEGITLRRDFFFLINHRGRDVIAADRNRIGGSNLERDVTNELLELLRGAGRFLRSSQFHQNTDLAAQVDVGTDQAIALHFEALVTADLNVFADTRDSGNPIGFEIGIGIGGNLGGQLRNERLETVVARDEIGLTIDFDQHADATIGGDCLADEAFVGGTIRLFDGGGGTLLAQDVDGGLEIALGFVQGFFTSHESGTGHGAKLTN